MSHFYSVWGSQCDGIWNCYYSSYRSKNKEIISLNLTNWYHLRETLRTVSCTVLTLFCIILSRSGSRDKVGVLHAASVCGIDEGELTMTQACLISKNRNLVSAGAFRASVSKLDNQAWGCYIRLLCFNKMEQASQPMHWIGGL